MLDDLITKTHSLEFEDADGALSLESIEWRGRSALDLTLRLFWSEQYRETWRVSCNYVLGYRFLQSRASLLEVYYDHPLLWPHQGRFEQLYVSSKPSDSAAVFGSLVETYLESVGSWLPLLRFINSHVPTIRLLDGGSGLLATAPKPIIDRFCAVLTCYGVRHNTLSSAHWAHRANIELEPRVLVFGDSFVIAQKIEAEDVRQ